MSVNQLPRLWRLLRRYPHVFWRTAVSFATGARILGWIILMAGTARELIFRQVRSFLRKPARTVIQANIWKSDGLFSVTCRPEGPYANPYKDVDPGSDDPWWVQGEVPGVRAGRPTRQPLGFRNPRTTTEHGVGVPAASSTGRTKLPGSTTLELTQTVPPWVETRQPQARGLRTKRPRILIVAPHPIFPPFHGGGARLWNLLRRVALDCEIHLFLLSRRKEDPIQEEALATLASTVEIFPWEPELAPDFLGLEAPAARWYSSSPARRRISEILKERSIDILQLEYTEAGQYAFCALPGVKVGLAEYVVTFRERARRRAAGFHRRFRHDRWFGSSRLDWMRQLRYELSVIRRADAVQTVSDEDARFLAGFLAHPERIRVVPNGVDPDEYRPPPRPVTNKRLLFVGNFDHLPNFDGLEWLLSEIWPKLLGQDPELFLTVAGSGGGPDLARICRVRGVDLVGEVNDLRPLYREHQILLAPIRVGSGTRIKILEALASGLPVVSTPVGAEGLECRDGVEICIARETADWCAAIQKLLRNSSFHQSLAVRGRQLILEQYDWDRIAERLLEIWHDMLER